MSQQTEKKSFIRRLADGSLLNTMIAIVIGFVIGAVALVILRQAV